MPSPPVETDAAPENAFKSEIAVTVTVRPNAAKPEIETLKFTAENARLRVGRDPQNELFIQSSDVSRFHAALLMQADGRLLVSDLGSRNGTKLNNQSLERGRAYQVDDNDLLRFGETEARFNWAQSTVSRAELTAQDLAAVIAAAANETDAAESSVLDETIPPEKAAELLPQEFSESAAAPAAEIAAEPSPDIIEPETALESKIETKPEAETKAESEAQEETESKTEKATASVARSAGIVSIAVMFSRVLGLVREIVFARFFGAGFLYDAFLVGFRIPNLLRDLFAEGALSAAFVKVFTDYQIKKSEAEAWRLASLIFNALAVVLSVITILGIFLSPYIVAALTYNYTGDPNYVYPAEKAALAALLMQIMFPFILLVALAALAMGVLNTKGKFGIPASASTAFNIVSIITGLGLAFWLSGGSWEMSDDKNLIPSAAAQWAIIGVGIGTVLGGAAQFLIQVPSLLKTGFRFSPILSFTDEGVRRVAGLMAPALLGVSAVQIKVLVDTALVSGIDGGQSWLSYAFRLMQFPIGVFGVALGTAAIPTLSRLASQNDFAGYRKTLAGAINLVFLLTIPSACGLIFLGEPIVRLLYEGGRFDAADTAMTTWALIGYSIGLTGYAAIKIVSPAFYALDDAKTPMIVSLVSIAVHIITGVTMMRVLSNFGVTPENPNGLAHVGVTIATSTVALVNFLALTLLMRRKVQRIEGRAMLTAFVKIIIAAALLSAVCYFSYRLLHSYFAAANVLFKLIEVFVPIAFGGAVFVAAAKLLGVKELNQAFDAFARKLKRKN